MFSFINRFIQRFVPPADPSQITIAEAARKYRHISKGMLYYLINRKKDHNLLQCLVQSRDILYLDEDKYEKYLEETYGDT
jgi:hypothetical protein